MAGDQLRLPFVDYVAEVVGAVLESPRATRPLEVLIDTRLSAAEPRLLAHMELLLHRVLEEREKQDQLLSREESAKYLAMSLRNFERAVAAAGDALEPEKDRGPQGKAQWRRGKLAAYKRSLTQPT